MLNLSKEIVNRKGEGCLIMVKSTNVTKMAFVRFLTIHERKMVIDFRKPYDAE